MGLFDKSFGPPTKEKLAKPMMDAIRQAGEKGESIRNCRVMYLDSF